MQLCGTGSLTRQNNIFLANDTGRWKIEIAPPQIKNLLPTFRFQYFHDASKYDQHDI